MNKIVCIGGGNGMPKAALKALKHRNCKIYAICAMLDTGGSSGRLRKDYSINAPGDIRRALIALANTSPIIENLFNYRFEYGSIKGHNFANLLIAALELSNGNFETAINTLKNMLNIKHEVLPATLDKSDLYAELENGEILKGESNIDKGYKGRARIKRVFLKPEAKLYPKAREAIENADYIIIGPGDLYSSIAQILLLKGIKKAFKKSKAKIIHICNIFTKTGETEGYYVEDFVSVIENYIGKNIDYVIINNKKIKSKKENLITEVKAKEKKDNYIFADLVNNAGEHNPKKVEKVLEKIIPDL